MKSIVIYSTNKSARIDYICDLVFREILGLDIKFIDSLPDTDSLNHPLLSFEEIDHIPSTYLKIDPFLLEETHTGYLPSVSKYNGLPILFEHGDQTSLLPFCILSTCFYLVSRYEEYETKSMDEHGRYESAKSLAYQHNFLSIPLVDIWVFKLKKLLQQRYPDLNFGHNQFKMQPTYDIDHGYAFAEKPFGRQALSVLKNIVKIDLKRLKAQWTTHLKKDKDPYDTYQWIIDQYADSPCKPLFFWLLGDLSKYDRNISHHNQRFKKQIQVVDQQFECGIHPSYDSFSTPSKLRIETDRLEKIRSKPTKKSRQHFVRFQLPTTYRQLIYIGIQDDYSMGYANKNGFRASIARSFFWFDIDKNEKTNLRIHPFMFMDVTSKNYLKQHPKESIEEARHMIDSCYTVGGDFIFIWHNSSLSTLDNWDQWIDVHQFIIDYSKQKSTS